MLSVWLFDEIFCAHVDTILHTFVVEPKVSGPNYILPVQLNIVRHTVVEKVNLSLVVSISHCRVLEIFCFGENNVDILSCFWVRKEMIEVLWRVAELKYIKIAESGINFNLVNRICHPQISAFKDNNGSSIVVTGQCNQRAALAYTVTMLFAGIKVDIKDALSTVFQILGWGYLLFVGFYTIHRKLKNVIASLEGKVKFALNCLRTIIVPVEFLHVLRADGNHHDIPIVCITVVS